MRVLKSRFSIRVLFFVVLIVLFFNFSLQAEENNTFYLIFLDGMDFDDLREYKDLPGLKTFLDNSYVGMMNVNTAARFQEGDTFLTIATGARARGDNYTEMAFNKEEDYLNATPSELYLTRYGLEVPEGDVLHLGLPALRKTNKNLPYDFLPGALGQLLTNNHINRVVLGNSDRDTPIRLTPIVLIDEVGSIDKGLISSDINESDKSFPYGKRINYEKVKEKIIAYNSNDTVIVVEIGDLRRVEQYRGFISEDREKELVASTYLRLGQFLRWLFAEGQAKSENVVLLSPSPSQRKIRSGRQLAPILYYDGKDGGGLLTSPSTRQRGLLLNLDIAPTILKSMVIDKPYHMVGEAFYGVDEEEPLAYIAKRLERIENVYSLRRPMIRFYIFLIIVFVLTGLVGILLMNKKTAILMPIYLLLLLVPWSILILAIFPPLNLYLAIFLMLLIAGVAAFILHLFISNKITVLFLIGILTTFALLLDLWQGAPLISTSVLGYDPIGGARFYGLGNEYMGVLIGSTILTSACIFQVKYIKYYKVIVILLLLFTIYSIAEPSLGANFGGTLASLGSFVITLYLLLNLQDKKSKGRHILVASVILFSFVLFFLNLTPLSGDMSHWGRTIILLSLGGREELLNIVNRKTSMNIMLIRYSIWSRVFFTFVLTTVLLFFKPPGLVRDFKEKYTDIFSGLIGITIAAFIGFFTNDSGVVAAATTFLFASLPLLYLIIDHINIRPN